MHRCNSVTQIGRVALCAQQFCVNCSFATHMYTSFGLNRRWRNEKCLVLLVESLASRILVCCWAELLGGLFLGWIAASQLT